MISTIPTKVLDQMTERVPLRRLGEPAEVASVYAFLAEHKPDYLFIAAAKVGGIQANNVYRADFLTQNLLIEANLIDEFRLFIHPIVLGSGKRLFPEDHKMPLKLIQAQPFSSGVVVHEYRLGETA